MSNNKIPSPAEPHDHADAAPGAGTYGYRLFGLAVESQIELPELSPISVQLPDVRVVRGPVAPTGKKRRIGGLSMIGSAGVIDTPEMRYRIEGGTTITVDAEPAASERNVRLFLLGSVFGALLHQRGIVPLHANAIEVGGRAVAFAGVSGSGKSTLAAAFLDRGYRLLCDDICAVTPAPGGGFLAQPGIPRVRLWRDAVERTGRRAELLDLAFDGMEKYVVPIDTGRVDAALPLAAVVLLVDGEADSAPALHPLPAASGARALIANTYRGAYIPLIGDSRRHFETCVALARSTPMFELHRPWDAARIEEIVDRIEAQFAALRG